MSDKYSFIYILVLENGKIFKIGKSNDIIKRYGILKSKWGNFNLTKSYQIKCKENSIFKIEKTLHYIFKDFNILPDCRYDGYIEWFDIQCYDDVIDFLNYLKNINKDILNIHQGISIPQKNKSYSWELMSKEEKKEKINQNKIRKQEKNLKDNIQNAIMLVNILNDLKDNIIFFNKEQNLIVFRDIYRNKIDLLSNYQDFNWSRGGFSFITSSSMSGNLSYLDLQFNFFEKEDMWKYLELYNPYKILMIFFNELDFSVIESDINTGIEHIKEQSKLWDNVFEQIGLSKN